MEITNKTKIEDCEISVRLINYLKTNGIYTIGDLIRKEPLFFAKQRFRVSVVKELENFMKGNNLHFNGIDKKTDIDWEQRRYELSKAAMEGILSNLCGSINREEIVKVAIKCAEEIIKQLKESEAKK
jgi:hypothetical protein